MLKVNAEGVCWKCMLKVYAESVCWKCMLKVYIEVVYWRCMLKVYAEGICWRWTLKMYAKYNCWRWMRKVYHAEDKCWMSMLKVYVESCSEYPTKSLSFWFPTTSLMSHLAAKVHTCDHRDIGSSEAFTELLRGVVKRREASVWWLMWYCLCFRVKPPST